MQKLLSDHNCEGQARAILFALQRLGLYEIAPVELLQFSDVDLDYNADDETVWRHCQENKTLLITGNRRTVDGQESLELTVRRLLKPTSLPVLTIGNLKRVKRDRAYAERCAENLADVVIGLDRYLGTMRLYL